MSKRFGHRAWPVHMAVITPGWALFLIFINAQLGDTVRWALPQALRPLGWVLLVVALALFGASMIQLGIRRTFNGYCFGSPPSDPIAGGVYRWLENPMYDGFWLAFVASALIRANAVYPVLAVASYLLLNRCEARVENGPFKASA